MNSRELPLNWPGIAADFRPDGPVCGNSGNFPEISRWNYREPTGAIGKFEGELPRIAAKAAP